MQPATGGLERTTGSGQEVPARAEPTVLPTDLSPEWAAISRGHHNLLLVGPPSATDAVLIAMRRHLREPLQEYRPTTGVSVPEPLAGTLVLLEVARLDAKQQAQLLQWLEHVDDHVGVQVVSTTSEPLFSLVQTGAFLVDLYYKLNVVLIDLIGAGEHTT